MGSNTGDGQDIPLGKSVAAVQAYSPDLLFPIARGTSREALGWDGELPFVGEDLWTGYELSWLDESGKPQVAIVVIRFPSTSPNIIESKSLKLYLNSYYAEPFHSRSDVQQCIARDLTNAAGQHVAVEVVGVEEGAPLSTPEAILIDNQAIVSCATPDAALLGSSSTEKIVEELLVSHLLRSLCPVTGQPDWATLYISYTGRAIDRAALLSYIVSFREHQDFHEHCVERIFCDVWQVCQPEQLSVYARYLRRGGLDINPWRSSTDPHAPDWRTMRQ